ncbi:MAG: efflux RND transporter periplasmic adaptor subunit [Sphingomonas sp.]
MSASIILCARGSVRPRTSCLPHTRADTVRARRSRAWTILLLLALSSASACARHGDDGAKKRQPPLVDAAPATPHVFSEEIETIGTARANEQVTLAANVTERVDRLLFDDGMIVRRGQLLAVLSQSQEQASLTGAVASEVQARTQLQRVEQLSKLGFVTRSLLDTQTATVGKARADAAAIRAQINDRMIRAPFSGHVSLRTISEGSIVTSGTPIVTISDVSRIKLDFTVPETKLKSLRAGQTIRAVAATFPDAPLVGTISVIDPVIDLSSRAAMVRAILPNPGGRIKPGMLLTVKIETGRRAALAVPEIAIVSEGEHRYVFVVDATGKAKRSAVQTGLRDNGLIEVTGLPSTARVISEGVVKVTDGMKVRLASGKRKPGAS